MSKWYVTKAFDEMFAAFNGNGGRQPIAPVASAPAELAAASLYVVALDPRGAEQPGRQRERAYRIWNSEKRCPRIDCQRSF